MMRIKKLVLILFALLFLVSCDKNDLDDIAKTGDWDRVKELTTEIIETKGLEKEALYYNALSLYYTKSYNDAVDAARIYILMYDKTNPIILKILLYKGISQEAYSAGETLIELNAMNSNDKIQFFKVLNDLDRIDEAALLISDLKNSLPVYNYCFALINGNATSMLILESLEMLYKEEGISNNFLSIADKAFNIFSNREYRVKPQSFIEDTFDGNAQYALIIGDFYFSIMEKDKALYYWSYAKDMYPNAYRTRIENLT